MKVTKIAQGHIEVILSFLLFIGFVIAIFAFFNPFSHNDPTDSVSERTERVITQNISDEVGILSVIVNNNLDCYKISGTSFGMNFHETIDNPRKYTLYFSDLVNEYHPNELSTCLPDKYTLGAYTKEEMLIYQKIVDLKGKYESDYKSLRNSLGIVEDFSFSIRETNGQEIPELSVNAKTPAGLERKAKEIPIIVINSSADIRQLILNIKTW